LDALEVKIEDIKEGAEFFATRSQVPIPLILSVGLFESDKYFDELRSWSAIHHDHGHDHHDHDHHSHHLENDGFTSLSFQ